MFRVLFLGAREVVACVGFIGEARRKADLANETDASNDLSLTEEEDAEHIYLSGLGGLSATGDGTSVESPWQICAPTSAHGVPQEYAHLERRFGTLGEDWWVDIRSLARNSQGRMVETFRISMKDRSRAEYHFDVSAFYDR